MVWVLVFGGIAVLGLVMVVCYGVWLAHKTADLLSETSVLADRLAELGGLAAQIQPPGGGSAAGGSSDALPSDPRVSSEHRT